jgi:hypothetical protein
MLAALLLVENVGVEILMVRLLLLLADQRYVGEVKGDNGVEAATEVGV